MKYIEIGDTIIRFDPEKFSYVNHYQEVVDNDTFKMSTLFGYTDGGVSKFTKTICRMDLEEIEHKGWFGKVTKEVKYTLPSEETYKETDAYKDYVYLVEQMNDQLKKHLNDYETKTREKK